MPWYAILAAILVSFCWGGNFSATKIAMMDFPPILSLLLRFVAVSLVLAPFALRRMPWPRMRDMLFIGITLIVLQFALVFMAMHLGLTIASVVIATQMGVPFSCLMAAILYKDYLGPWRSFGLTVALLGVVVVAGTPNAAEHWGAFLLAIAGSFAWSTANIYLKRMPPTPIVALLFWPALFSLLPLLVMTWLMEDNQIAIVREAALSSWLGIGYSMVFSSILGYGLWNWLMTRYPMSQVVPYSLFVPVAGISAGVLIFGETVTWQMILGAALTIIGVGIITLRRPRLAALEKI